MYEKIKEMLINDGACFVGCSRQEETPFPGLDYCISFGIKLSSAIVDTIDEKGPSKTYFHHYRTVNTRLDQMALSAVIELERMGYNGANIPASQSTEGVRGLFSHKRAAVSAGLGWIGKSALFISRETGPLVRLATVFTDMPLPVTEHLYEDGCKDCDICKKMCPSGAISGKNWSRELNYSDFFDPELCSHYMKDHFKDIGRGAVCGICMRFCKYNKRK